MSHRQCETDQSCCSISTMWSAFIFTFSKDKQCFPQTRVILQCYFHSRVTLQCYFHPRVTLQRYPHPQEHCLSISKISDSSIRCVLVCQTLWNVLNPRLTMFACFPPYPKNIKETEVMSKLVVLCPRTVSQSTYTNETCKWIKFIYFCGGSPDNATWSDKEKLHTAGGCSHQ